MGHVALDAVILGLSLWGAVQLTIRTIRVRTSDGISMGMTMLTLHSCMAWTVYGFVVAQPTQILNNAIFAVGWLALLATAVCYDGFKLLHALAALMGCACVVTAAATFGGQDALGLIATISLLIARLPQGVESWRNPAGRGVSIEAFAINAFQSMLWVFYGMGHSDGWIVGTSLYAASHSTFVVMRAIQGRRAERRESADEYEYSEVLPAAG